MADSNIDLHQVKSRETWATNFDFLVSCLGYAVGLGNIWRFPYMCYTNGGGAFLVPYTIMLFVVGIPIFFLELSLGQYTSSGPVSCWKFANLFQGLGFGMLTVSCIAAVYYNMIIAWALFYLFASFQSELPWAECHPEWSSPLCWTNFRLINRSECASMNYEIVANGACYYEGKLAGVYDEELAREHNIRKTLPTVEYLNNVAFGYNCTAGFSDLGAIRWDLVGCYLPGWLFVMLALSRSLKLYARVVYFTALFPYVVLFVLLIRGVTLPGFELGISYYLTPDFSKLANIKVWKEAAQQIFFSLSASWGGLIALSSYNKFKNDILRDTLIITFGNCLTSILAGFVVFSFLGFLSHKMDIHISEVAVSGPALVFEIYPYAVSLLPGPVAWSIIFFVMLVLLGLDTQLVLVETIVTCLFDLYPHLRRYKMHIIVGICTVFCFLGIVLATERGVCLLGVMDNFVAGWNLFLIAICECLAISYVYGFRRFALDVEAMTGRRVCWCCIWPVVKYYFLVCWAFVTPATLMFVLFFSLLFYTRLEGVPYWAEIFGWLVSLSAIVAVVVPGLVYLCQETGSLKERIRKGVTPSIGWGPAKFENRKLIAACMQDVEANPKTFQDLQAGAWGLEPEVNEIFKDQTPKDNPRNEE